MGTILPTSGTASIRARYAAIAIVILVMWRTSSRIGVGSLIAGYFHLPGTSRLLPPPGTRGAAGTAAAHPA